MHLHGNDYFYSELEASQRRGCVNAHRLPIKPFGLIFLLPKPVRDLTNVGGSSCAEQNSSATLYYMKRKHFSFFL